MSKGRDETGAGERVEAMREAARAARRVARGVARHEDWQALEQARARAWEWGLASPEAARDFARRSAAEMGAGASVAERVLAGTAWLGARASEAGPLPFFCRVEKLCQDASGWSWGVGENKGETAAWPNKVRMTAAIAFTLRLNGASGGRELWREFEQLGGGKETRAPGELVMAPRGAESLEDWRGGDEGIDWAALADRLEAALLGGDLREGLARGRPGRSPSL